MKQKFLSILLLATLSLTACGKEQAAKPSDRPASNQTQKAIDLTLTDMKGNSYGLSEFADQRVYLKFWGSWCPICLDGLDRFNDYAGKDKDYEILTVIAPNQMGEKSKEDFIEWFNSLGYENIKVLFDETGDFLRAFGINAAPTNIIKVPNKPAVVAPGEIDEETIDMVFEKLS